MFSIYWPLILSPCRLFLVSSVSHCRNENFQSSTQQKHIMIVNHNNTTLSTFVRAPSNSTKHTSQFRTNHISIPLNVTLTRVSVCVCARANKARNLLHKHILLDYLVIIPLTEWITKIHIVSAWALASAASLQRSDFISHCASLLVMVFFPFAFWYYLILIWARFFCCSPSLDFDSLWTVIMHNVTCICVNDCPLIICAKALIFMAEWFLMGIWTLNISPVVINIYMDMKTAQIQRIFWAARCQLLFYSFRKHSRKKNHT